MAQKKFSSAVSLPAPPRLPKTIAIASGMIVDEKHWDRMGKAMRLFLLLIAWQTGEKDGRGIVLYGAPLCFKQISARSGIPVRTLQRYATTLVEHHYIGIKYTRNNWMRISIANEKKFAGRWQRRMLKRPARR